jgi:hypothetical protein
MTSLTKDQIGEIENILLTHEKHKGCYMWSGDNGNLGQRRRQEFDNHYQFDDVSVSQAMTQSRKNTYYQLRVEVDGVKKDVRVLKNLIKNQHMQN